MIRFRVLICLVLFFSFISDAGAQRLIGNAGTVGRWRMGLSAQFPQSGTPATVNVKLGFSANGPPTTYYLDVGGVALRAPFTTTAWTGVSETTWLSILAAPPVGPVNWPAASPAITTTWHPTAPPTAWTGFSPSAWTTATGWTCSPASVCTATTPVLPGSTPSTWYGSFVAEYQVAMEFTIPDSIMAGLTPNNFTARLGGLTVTTAYPPYTTTTSPGGSTLTWGNPSVALYDLVAADGNPGVNDFNNMGARLHTLFTQIPEPGTRYRGLDVTDALRQDLFGGGASSPYYTAFLLRNANVGNSRFGIVGFNAHTPHLTINKKEYVPTATQWGLLLFGMLLGAMSLWQLRRVRKAS